MLFIYTDQVTNRVSYAVDWIMRHILKAPYRLVEREGDLPADALVVNYSHREIPAAQIHLRPCGLLAESDVRAHAIRMTEYRGHPAFFPVEAPADLPYDPFAVVFYLLSRYEEYLPFEADVHGRFPARASLAYRSGFLDVPLADRAAGDVRALIHALRPELCASPPPLTMSFTYDLDAPFAFRGKGLAKNAGAAVTLALRGRYRLAADRLGYLAGKSADPFDIFEDLLRDLDQTGHRATFFLLLEHRGRRNPAPPATDARYRQIVRDMREAGHRLGLHPSYGAGKSAALTTEIARFRDLTGEKPALARMHFLRLKFPDTCRLLEATGLKEDHSMAFPDMPGFRAGTARPFRFYDLEDERLTGLEIHPYCLMDATLEYYPMDGKTPDFKAELTRMGEAIRPEGGTLGTIWHNDLLSEYLSPRPWRDCHDYALNFT